MSFKKLFVHLKKFKLSMAIFEIHKIFPTKQKYFLADQIRHLSISISTNFTETYLKNNYPKHFIGKLIVTGIENCETNVWLRLAFTFGYIKPNKINILTNKGIKVGKTVNFMINNPNDFDVTESFN